MLTNHIFENRTNTNKPSNRDIANPVLENNICDKAASAGTKNKTLKETLLISSLRSKYKECGKLFAKENDLEIYHFTFIPLKLVVFFATM